jgi:hypothetical protein
MLTLLRRARLMMSSDISGCPMITLADGQQHTAGVMVFNASSFFLAKTDLLVFTDCGSRQVIGGVLSNDLTPAPMPVVSAHIATTAKGSTGSIRVESNRNFITISYVNKSQECVETTVRESVNFKSKQNFKVNANTGIQDAVQTSTVESTGPPAKVKEVQRETGYYDRSAVPDERDHRSKWPSPSTRAK